MMFAGWACIQFGLRLRRRVEHEAIRMRLAQKQISSPLNCSCYCSCMGILVVYVTEVSGISDIEEYTTIEKS